MITKLDYKVDSSLFETIPDLVPEFDSRIALNVPTGDFFYDPWKISQEFSETIWGDVLNSLPLRIGEARLVKLHPGSAYYSHADIDDRYHLNILGEKSFLVDLDQNILHSVYNDSFWYEMDAGVHHSAVNFGNETRIQLVVRKLLEKNNLHLPVRIKISLINYRTDYRFIFDDIFSPYINRLIKKGKADNFGLLNNEVFLDIEKEYVKDIKSISPDDFQVRECQLD